MNELDVKTLDVVGADDELVKTLKDVLANDVEILVAIVEVEEVDDVVVSSVLPAATSAAAGICATTALETTELTGAVVGSTLATKLTTIFSYDTDLFVLVVTGKYTVTV